MLNILVTGGAGYIGSTLVPELLNLGHKVTVLDNFMYRQTSLNHCAIHDNFEIVRGDVRSDDLMKSLFKKADVIFPLAALVGAPICNADPFAADSINKLAVLSMLDQISKDQIVIMPTTNSAYGSGDGDNFCTEESPLSPISKYAIDKVKVEQELMSRENAISLRLATVFGLSPRMRIDLLVNDFTFRAVHDGFIVLFESNFKRNYIHVRDISRVFQHCLVNFHNMKSNVFNVGLSTANISKLELCKKIKEQVPNFVILEEKIGSDPDQRNYVVSNSKIESTGFEPKYSIENGVRELIKGYRMIKHTDHKNF
ncbi:MAG: NAD-dependent epimerase/dehydratase family protein [Burkholderiaceae bacterium]|nr:MAG: hypothetical protein CBC60_02750 [Betaproteobacteria bacterium TMED100]|tara:strand:- start:884 stop:1819 length:936 start_codon:yes stop_codon:yes gene_type:complete